MTTQVFGPKMTASRTELQLISKIARNYLDIVDSVMSPALIDLAMDIEACHCNGNPLRLIDLVQAKDHEVIHDVGGIYRHLDRRTGKLRDGFSPRYSA